MENGPRTYPILSIYLARTDDSATFPLLDHRVYVGHP